MGKFNSILHGYKDMFQKRKPDFTYLYGRALRRQDSEPTDITEVDGHGIKRLRLHFFAHFQLFCY